MSGIAKCFLDDMVANIDEDTPRLVFADWLQENGQELRAEFIRVQVERARLPAWDPAQVKLRLRENELLKKHGESWLAEMPAVEGAKWEGFRRGIVAEVSFTDFEAMRNHAHECRLLAPVEAVTVRWPRRREGRKDVPPIAELRELTLTGRPGGEEEVGWLADSPQLATLRSLTARGLWEQGLRRLVASPHLSKLKSLRMPSSSNLGHAGILVLIGADSLNSLEELDLSGRGVSERYSEDPLVRSPGMEALSRWPGLATVRTLNLSGNDLGRIGLRALLRSKHVGSLKHLSVRACRLDGQSTGEFDSALKGLRLESLDIGENVLKDLGAEYVALVPCLSELKSLKMDRCEVSQHGAKLFAKKAKFFNELRELDISFNHFGAPGLEALLKRASPTLHTLKMRDNDLHLEGAELLASSPAAEPLLELDLGQNKLGPDATKALGESQHLNNLAVLQLTHNPIIPAVGKELAASPLGKRLTVLEYEYTPPPPPLGHRLEDPPTPPILPGFADGDDDQIPF